MTDGRKKLAKDQLRWLKERESKGDKLRENIDRWASSTEKYLDLYKTIKIFLLDSLLKETTEDVKLNY